MDKEHYRLQIEEDDIDLDVKFLVDGENEIVRVKPKKPKAVMYENAVALAADIELAEGACYYAILSGDFIFGDFIEALIDHHDLRPERVDIATLGMNQNNIDSVKNIAGFAGKVNLIVSHYYFNVERAELIPYMMGEYKDTSVSVAVAGSHMKLALIRDGGLGIVISGSANLSSSNSVEQFTLMCDSDLWEWNAGALQPIYDNFTVFEGNRAHFERDRKNNGRKLWRTMTNGR